VLEGLNPEDKMIKRKKVKSTLPTKEQILDYLNDQQKKVVKFFCGAALVVAVAGSGKTRALVHRIAYLIAVRKVGPQSILAVTFSKKAADEMTERLEQLGVYGCRVGTWHSLCYEILRKETDLGEWEVDSKDRFRVVVKQVLGYKGMNWKKADLTKVLSYISLCKANLAEAGSEKAEEIAQELFDSNPCAQTNPTLLVEAYWRAQEAAEARQLLTFDDMLVFVWRLFQDESVRVRWASRFDFVLQDEAQDANLAQIELATLLAKDHRNYMVVGDPGQSIFGFRGAVPEKLLQFKEDWDADIVKMHINYRSANEILDAANNVIDSMEPGTHLDVKIEGAKNSRTEVKVHELMDQDVEGERIANEILELNSSGMDWKDVAVLYRTNAQSRGVEEQLISHRIPYVVIGGTNFYDRKEVKDLLSYLRCAVNRDEESFKRCINAPFRYLGNVFRDRVVADHYSDETWTETAKRIVDQGIGVQYRQKTSVLEWSNLIDSISRAVELRKELEGDLVSQGIDRDAIKYHPTIKDYMPAAILERIVDETDYLKFIARDEGAETVENNRVSNVRELIRAAERFTTVEELLEYIDATLDVSKQTRATRDKNRVILTTLHRSKGLEWKTVFIIGVSEKILPHGKAEDLGEERRLFYVGVTRAMEHLYISSIRSAALGQGVFSLEPSRFLKEARLSFQNTGASSE
jgi:DNA helicase-2/ATP-dependent DNA helicase PcrA